MLYNLKTYLDEKQYLDIAESFSRQLGHYYEGEVVDHVYQEFPDGLVMDLSFMFYESGFYADASLLKQDEETGELEEVAWNGNSGLLGKYQLAYNGNVYTTELVLDPKALDALIASYKNLTDSELMEHGWGEFLPGTGRAEINGWLELQAKAIHRLQINAKDFKYHPKTFEALKRLCDDNTVCLGDIDTSEITNMSELFYYSTRPDFSGIEKWNVSNVTDMSRMFYDATTFNGDISRWDTSNVETMKGMFCGAKNFNGNISQWKTASVRDMSSMFSGAEKFNQPIGDWNTTRVKDMHGMFNNAINFNQDIGCWDTSNVINMSAMFYNAKAFNQRLNEWKTSRVITMDNMFHGAAAFNQPLDKWDICHVKELCGMFAEAKAFNQDISQWDISKVTNMSCMFEFAESFNQNLKEWKIPKTTGTFRMFEGCQIATKNLPKKVKEKAPAR